MVSIRIVVATAGLVAAVVFGTPVAEAAEPEPMPEGDLSRFESTMVEPGLSVTVDRDGRRLRANRDTTYTITVHYQGERPESLTIRVALPPWMVEASPDDQGEVGNGFVQWPVTVEPGLPTTLRLTGIYAVSPDGERPGGPVRVAFTACALDQDDGQPIVCATDIAELSTRSTAAQWWMAGTGAIVLAAAVALLTQRHRFRQAAAGLRRVGRRRATAAP